MHYAMGIDVGGTSIKAGVVSETGEIIGHAVEKPLLVGIASPEDLLQQTTSVFQELSGHGDAVIAVGLGVPGCVSSDGGQVEYCSKIPALNGYPLAPALQEKVRMPVFMDNSTNNAGRAEKCFGAAKGVRDFVLITMGTGIGGAIFTNGQLVVGKGGFAGELGHICLAPDGSRHCSCGRTGCWEAHGSGRALVESVLDSLNRGTTSSLESYKSRGLTAKHVLEEARSGDPLALKLVKEWCRWNAIGIANMINILNCEVCAVGGGLSLAGPFLLDMIKEFAKEFALPCSWLCSRIVLAQFRNTGGLVGSAALAFERTNS